MEFLKQLALPQSLEHFHLVVLIAGLSALILIPYLSVALGSAILSVRMSRLGREENNPTAVQFARNLVETVIATKALVAFLAVIPGLSLLFTLAQILHGTPSIAVSLAGLGFVFLLLGSVLLYAHRYTFRVEGLLESYQSLIRKLQAKGNDGFEDYRKSNASALHRSGAYGTIILFAAAYLYIAAITVAIAPATWSAYDSFLDVLLSLVVWLRFLLFLSFAAAATGSSVLFFTFSWKAGEYGEDEALMQFARRYGTQLSIAGLLATPAFLVVNLAMVSEPGLAGIVYGLAGGALLFLFIAAHFVYAHHMQRAGTSSIAASFFAILVAGGMLVLADFFALGYATRTHAEALAREHDKATAELQASLGVSLVAFTGEDIYNGKCSACHLFDQKKIGPPYLETIPKYQGKKADLITFILNPAKKNSAYPPMPNQGLRPAEADSIAGYIMARVAALQPAKR